MCVRHRFPGIFPSCLSLLDPLTLKPKMTKKKDPQYKTPDLSFMTNKDFLPTFHDVYTILNVTIVGEDEAKMSLFLNWICARKYIVLSGQSRSGKTWVKDHVAELLGDEIYTLKSGSKKSGWYDAENIQKAQYLDIPELNQLPEEMQEVLKTWGENKTATYQVVQTDPVTKKKTNEKHILPYRPFVFCIADENALKVPRELRYRLIEIRTDGSVQQNKHITKKQAESALLGIRREEHDEEVLKNLKMHLKTMPPFEKYSYRNPGAFVVERTIPKMFTDSRTVHPLFQEAVVGAQRFHWKESMIVQRKRGKPLMFLSPQAIMLAYIITGKVFIDSSLKCNDLQKLMLEVMQFQGGRTPMGTIKSELKSRGINHSESVFKRQLDDLTEMGYVNKVDSHLGPVFEVAGLFKEQKLYIEGQELLDECKQKMKENYPEHYEKYEEMYLKDTTFTHPFTGEKMELEDVKIGENTEKREAPKTGIHAFAQRSPQREDNPNPVSEYSDGTIPLTEETVEPLEPPTKQDLLSMMRKEKTLPTEQVVDMCGETVLEELMEKGEIIYANKEGKKDKMYVRVLE